MSQGCSQALCANHSCVWVCEDTGRIITIARMTCGIIAIIYMPHRIIRIACAICKITAITLGIWQYNCGCSCGPLNCPSIIALCDLLSWKCRHHVMSPDPHKWHVVPTHADLSWKCQEWQLDISLNSIILTMPDDMTCHVGMASVDMSSDSFGHNKKTAKLYRNSCRNGMIRCKKVMTWYCMC